MKLSKEQIEIIFDTIVQEGYTKFEIANICGVEINEIHDLERNKTDNWDMFTFEILLEKLDLLEDSVFENLW